MFFIPNYSSIASYSNRIAVVPDGRGRLLQRSVYRRLGYGGRCGCDDAVDCVQEVHGKLSVLRVWRRLRQGKENGILWFLVMRG